VISHELDLMGLLHHGFSAKQLLTLVEWNSREFSRNGRYWNNFRYEVPGQGQGRTIAPQVMGDKKGDWTVRRLQQEPALLEKLERVFPRLRRKWILVLRDPWDNISTLGLRTGRVYDELRIRSNHEEEFWQQLGEHGVDGVPALLPDHSVDEYLDLCVSLETLKSRIPPADWHEVDYEEFLAAPEVGMSALCEFVGLEPDRAYLSAAASIVKPKPHRSRYRIRWTPEQIQRVRRAIGAHSILRAFDRESAAPLLVSDG
jgi:hypothetical protein